MGNVLATLGIAKPACATEPRADFAAHGPFDRHVPACGKFLASSSVSLIKPALPALAPVERHGNDYVKSLFARQNLRQKLSKGCGQRLHPVVFVDVDQLPQRAFVGAVGINGIEPLQAGPAQPATPRFIQRIGSDKRRPASNTVMLRNQELGFGEAPGANPEFEKLLERDSPQTRHSSGKIRLKKPHKAFLAASAMLLGANLGSRLLEKSHLQLNNSSLHHAIVSEYCFPEDKNRLRRGRDAASSNRRSRNCFSSIDNCSADIFDR